MLQKLSIGNSESFLKHDLLNKLSQAPGVPKSTLRFPSAVPVNSITTLRSQDAFDPLASQPWVSKSPGQSHCEHPQMTPLSTFFLPPLEARACHTRLSYALTFLLTPLSFMFAINWVIVCHRCRSSFVTVCVVFCVVLCYLLFFLCVKFVLFV